MNDLHTYFATLFETTSGKKDGLFRTNEFYPSDRHVWKVLMKGLQDYLSEFSEKTNKELFIEFSRGSKINAFATKIYGEDKYIIAINHGAIMRLFAIFQTLCAEINVFPNIGKPNRYNRVKLKPFVEEDLILLLSHQHLARDESRRALADFCFSLSVEYLFFHELAHILRGHVGRIFNQQNRWVALGETYDKGELSLSTIERQAMELDADVHAVSWCLQGYFDQTSPVLWMPFWKPSPIGLEREFLAKTLLFVVGIMIHIINEAGKELGFYNVTSHPHSEVRFTGMFNTILSWMGVSDSNKERIKYEWFEEAWEAIHIACVEGLDIPSAFPTTTSDPNYWESMRVFHKTNELQDKRKNFEAIWSNFQLTNFKKW